MRKTIKAWMAKSAKDDFSILKEWDNGQDLALPGVFLNKGKRESWDKNDWPPVPVIVSIDTDVSQQSTGDKADALAQALRWALADIEIEKLSS